MKESAFPTYFTEDHALSMTLRDYFAAKAMQAWLTGYEGSGWTQPAKEAYEMADAMMEARK